MPFPPTLRARGGSNFYPHDRIRQLSPMHPGPQWGPAALASPGAPFSPLGTTQTPFLPAHFPSTAPLLVLPLPVCFWICSQCSF